MIYPNNFEQKIEFNLIRQMVLGYCKSEQGKKYAEKIRFSNDFDYINKLLTQTADFTALLQKDATFPAIEHQDLTNELNRISIEGSYIDTEALFELKHVLAVMSEVGRYFGKNEIENYYELNLIIEQFQLEDAIEQYVNRIVDDKGEIADNASPELKEIRRKILAKLSSIDRQINKILKSAKSSGWVQGDTEVTIRDGRPVIPMPSTHKRQIKGLVVDESATGQTVYVEPGEVQEINNEIRELKNAERREIIRILKEFTDFLRPFIPVLINNFKVLGIIDFIKAKATLALKIKGIKPILKSNPHISWNEAMHPLLYLHHQKIGKAVIPLNLKLDDENRILVISGPNAGGKSVCLKTTVLLQYMLQCGLLVPLKDDSEAGIFQRMFIDIGDEQSLENDLSTYSSHLLNMKNFIKHANAQSVFFIDEFGTGTEPQLGGAIAEAVLDNLNDKKAFGVLTTHYANLKLKARKGNGIINGAMLFDSKNIEPLFELKIGQPGSSFAFEIAKKIGFPENILSAAKKITGGKQLDFEQQLNQLDSEKKDLLKKQEEMQVADGFLSEMIEKYQKLSENLESSKKEMLENARKEALDVIQSSNKLIERTIKEIREAQADKNKTKALRKKVKEQEEVIKQETKPAADKKKKTKVPGSEKHKNAQPEISPGPIQAGDVVKVVDQNISGEVLEVQDDEVVIAFNSITFRTQLSKVEKTKASGMKFVKPSKTSISGILDDINDKVSNFQLKLDVRGQRGDEAIEKVRQYIDDAILLNIKDIKILHGKGFGILRNLIHDYLRTVPEIKQFKDEHVERGGSGITIVIFK